MPRSYDVILRSGAVVNHDGEKMRDIAIADGRIAAIGDLAQASAGGVRPPRTACAARRGDRVRLLPDQGEREFAFANAHRKPFGQSGGGFLAIGRDEFGESGEQARLRKAVAIDAFGAGFHPGSMQIA
jgi:hypothetical protein